MLRRSAVWLVGGAAGGHGQRQRHTYGTDEDDREGREGREKFEHVQAGGYGMKLEDAYRTFGFKFGDEVKKSEVQRRFKSLAKKAHPDLGGSEEAFRKVREAQAILVTHSHDRANSRGKDGKKSGRPKVNIVRETHAETMGSVTYENAEEHRNVSSHDWAMGAFIFFFFFYGYFSWINDNVLKANDGRSRLQEEQVKPLNEERMNGKKANTWHPWRASTGVKQELKAIEERRLERLETRLNDVSPFVTPTAAA